MDDTVYIVQTTLPGELNEAEVGIWSQSIIDSKLAACVDIKRITSVFQWKGEIQSTPEWSIQLITADSNKNELISKIKSEHSYDVPEILCWPAESTKEYSDWVKGE
jgi:periplasmic divalent cation tolerance protein